MARLKISELNIWERHEREVLSILFEALTRLCAQKQIPLSEWEINTKLLLFARTINFEHLKNGKGIRNTFSYEMVNQPRSDDSVNNPQLRKKPDIQIGFIDDLAENPDEVERYYCIECKRMGKNLNPLYVKNGVVRFVSEEYGYGRGEFSGAMVGYIQDMDFNDILFEVNRTIRKYLLETIAPPTSGWEINGVNYLSHKLQRTKVSPNEFFLRHLWADLKQIQEV